MRARLALAALLAVASPSVRAAPVPRPTDAQLVKQITPGIGKRSGGRLELLAARSGGKKGDFVGMMNQEFLVVEAFVHARVTKAFFGPRADGEREWNYGLLEDGESPDLERYDEGEPVVLVGEVNVFREGAIFIPKVAIRKGAGRRMTADDAAFFLRDFAAASKDLELTERYASDIERVGTDCKKIAQAFQKHAAEDARVLKELKALGAPQTEQAARYYQRRGEEAKEKQAPIQECQDDPAIVAYLKKVRP
jgi:hypothetical protein